MKLKLFLLFLVVENVSAFSNQHGSNRFVRSEESAYLKWIKQMGSSMTHVQYDKADQNKMEPCLTISVDNNATMGDFVSVQEAIDSLPFFNLCRVIIHIHKGIYREKVVVPITKRYVTLEGEDADETIIEWDDTADRNESNGRPMGTYGSATFSVNAPYFIAKNITFRNVAPLPPSGALGKQAVAIRISGDNAAFILCKFIGAQDTLYDHLGRHYFKNCYIEGSVDFIFGNGRSLYDGCYLRAVSNSYGALTAQKRDSMLDETGFSFINCRVTGSGALYLGRAWGTFSRVVFAYTYMDKIITPEGWDNWGDKNREMTVFFGQYKCYGPGSDYGGRVAWSREFTDQEAEPFISFGFIDGDDWLSDL
ncbi:Pectinesterase [Macleaya cordata]|uniref:Pectinesterase n=1 Tax=Macleaya cordata TaxID=56857 RepID=A0A200QQZ0_MACCD|nr:Pectinesterase [Macleaya cordata]